MARPKNTETGTGTGAGGGSQQSAFYRISTSERQNAIVYDVLSEGPIQGLVNGPSSIFLNDTPLMEKSIQGLYSATTSSDISYNSSTGVVTDNTSKMFTNRDAEEGTYTILIAGAKKASSGIGSATAGSTTITTSSSFFAANDVSITTLPQYVTLKGAGAADCEYIGRIVEYVSATEVRVQPEITTTVSNKDIAIDLVDTIDSFSSNTATLTNGGGITVSNVYGQLSTPTQTVTSTPKYNFENASFSFRVGTRDQDYLTGPAGLGSSSIVYNASDELPPTDFSALSGFGANYFAAGDWNNVTEATDTGFLKESSTMGVTNPEEVDLVKVSIKFPQGLYAHKAKSGAEDDTFAEFQIYFEYTRDGTNYTSDLIIGPTDAELSSRSIDWGGRAGRAVSPSTGFINAFNKTPFVKTISIDISDYQPITNYRIRVKRITPANAQHGDYVHYNATQLQAIENVITDKFSYPYTAYGAVSFSAQDFTDIPRRGYEIRGLKVKVPTNYFSRYELGSSTEAAYTRNVTTGANSGSYQDWDGNFRGDIKTFTSKSSPNYNPVWTDNPVWILMDVLTNDRYGIGKYIDPDDSFSTIDKYQLFQLAKYCDELVPDGKGGQEPRFSCNVYLKDTQEAQKVIKDLLQVFRGMLVWFDGKISPAINAYKSPVYTFTKGNVVGGEFGYQSTSRRFRSNQIRVTWNNPDNFYKQEVEIVEDFENIIETNRINPKEVVAFGCTSQGQAHRFGKWHLFTEKLDKEVVNFSTGLNAAFLKPGDVIEVQDPDITNTQYSGRVASATSSTTTKVYLDRAIDLSASGQSFELNLIYPKGGAYLAQESATINSVEYQRGDLLLTDEGGNAIDTEVKANNLKDDSNNLVQLFWSENVRIETQTISSYNSSGDVTVSSAFTEAPNSEVIWSITNRTVATGEKLPAAPKEYIILSISENTNEQTFDITAANHSNAKFDLIDRGYVIETVPEIRKEPTRTDTVPAPRNLSLSIVSSGRDSLADTTDVNSNGLDLIVSWEHPRSQRTDSQGNAINSKYEFIAGYEIRNNIFEGTEGKITNIKKVGAEVSSYRFKNIRPDIYTIEVRMKNNGGNYSKYIQKRINVKSGKEPISSGSRINSIPRGGQVDKSLTINSSTGLAEFSSSTYNLTTSNAKDFNFTATGSANYQQSFSGMGANAIAYLLFDASATSDHLKAIKVINNTTAVDANNNKLFIDYVSEVGAANSGLTAVSGTVTLAADSTEVTGSSTTFESDFEPGDRIFFGSGTTLFAAKVTFVDSNTKLQIDRTSSRAYTADTGSKLSFIPDFTEDTILAQVITDGSTNYSFQNIYAVTAGIVGADGAPGATGPRTATGYIYYQSSSAASPTSGAAVSTTSVAYNFSTSLLSGGVIGTGSTNWNQNPPTFTGSNSNKYWYAYYSVVESSFGGAYTVTFSIPYEGQNFTGLVTFTGTNTISDGTNTTTAITSTDLGSSGTTTIDGGRITTGTIDANRITLVGKNISDLTNNSGYVDSSGAAAAAPVQSVAGSTGAVTVAQLSSAGLYLSSNPSGYVNTSQAAAAAPVQSVGGYTGTVSVANLSAAGLTLTSSLSDAATTSVSTIRSGTTSADVGLGNVSNYSPANQVINGWNTTVTAGAIKLGNSSGARIELDATSANPRILIVDTT